MNIKEAEALLWKRTHDTEWITRAMQAAVRKTILSHKQNGYPLVAWRDNQVVHIPPDEIIVPKPAKRLRARRQIEKTAEE